MSLEGTVNSLIAQGRGERITCIQCICWKVSKLSHMRVTTGCFYNDFPALSIPYFHPSACTYLSREQRFLIIPLKFIPISRLWAFLWLENRMAFLFGKNKFMGTLLTVINVVVKYYHSYLLDIFINISEKSTFIS